MFAEAPPPQFDHEPSGYYRVVRLPAEDVVRSCFGIRIACAIPSRRLIIMDEDLKGEEAERILRHEKGHLNGWIEG